MQIVNPRVAPHSCSAFIGIKPMGLSAAALADTARVGGKRAQAAVWRLEVEYCLGFARNFRFCPNFKTNKNGQLEWPAGPKTCCSGAHRTFGELPCGRGTS